MADLTNTQLLAIKADIAANSDLNSNPNNADGNFEIARLYNLMAVPDYYVWSSNVQIADIMDAIMWANFTPADAADGTQTWTNRSLSCQGKQFNLQTMLVGRSSIDATKANIRGGLQDAMTALPSGPGGANRSGGWATVLLTLSRKARRVEKVLAAGTGTQLAPATAVFEGQISPGQVETARNL